MTTVYKLVQPEEDGYYSISAMGRYRTQYIPGEKVERPNIFVFTDLLHARLEHSRIGDEQIWECETESDPRPSPEWVPDFDHTSNLTYKGVSAADAARYIEMFWEIGVSGPLHTLKPLVGSYLVDDVKLIRRAE